MTALTTTYVDPTDINSNFTNAGFATGIFETDEVYIDADNKVFYFKNGGNFATAGTGISGQALYSFFKDAWKTDPYLPQYEFPMLSITNEQFEFINGWKIDDTQTVAQSGAFNATTRKMIRTAGWSEVETDGTVSRRYFGFISLGTLGATDQIYYVQDDSFTATTVDTDYTGPVNEAIQFFGNIDAAAGGDAAADDFIGEALITGITSASIVVSTKTVTTGAAHGLVAGDVVKIASAAGPALDGFYIIDSVPLTTTFIIRDALPSGATDQSDLTIDQVGFDRSTYYKAFVRTRGKTYADADLDDIGVSSTTYIVYRFPITNASDLNINTTDDAAFTGATVSLIDGDATTITVDTSGSHGLYAGAPVTISGTTGYNGDYVVATITDANTFTIADDGHNIAAETAGTTRVQYVTTMDVSYLPNPDTNTGDVVYRGDFTNGTAYALGDVVYDTASGNFYYADIAGTSNNTTVATDTGVTWALYTAGVRDIEEDGTNSGYTTVYDLNSGGTTPGATKEIAYEYAQYLLRTDSTYVGPVNTGSINADANSSDRQGNIADPLVFFVGSTLNTYSDPTIPFAVVLDDIADIDVNNIQYNDYENTSHVAPTVVQVTINFNGNLATDSDAIFYAYYTTGEGAQAGNDYGSPGAIEVQKVSGGVANTVGSDVSNNVPDGTQNLGSSYSFNYAYTADNSNGRTTGANATDVNITIVAIGLETGQYVSTSGNITATGASFSLVAPLERNYNNP